MTHIKVDAGRRISNHKNEKLDCVVRALAIALDLPYNSAHMICKDFGRKDRHCSYGTYNLLKYHLRLTAINPQPYKSLKQACEYLPSGRYIVLTRGHCQAIINNTLFDYSYNPRWKSQVKYIFQTL